MKILFYIEPAILMTRKMLLSAHANIARCIINANYGDEIHYGFASSEWICEEYRNLVNCHGGHNDINFYEIDPVKILSEHNFSLMDYFLSLNQVTNENHSAIMKQLLQIDIAFKPDIILCATQNDILKICFPDALIVNYEMTHIMREDGGTNSFFDFSGLYKNSAFNKLHNKIISLNISDDLKSKLLAANKTINMRKCADEELNALVKHWVKVSRDEGNKIALIALNPPNHPGVEGALNNITREQFLFKALQDLEENWKAIISFHPAEGFNLDIVEMANAYFPNVIILPEELRNLSSDYFLPYVDGVITIGSKTGFSALLLKKPTIFAGDCAYLNWGGKFGDKLSEVKPLTDDEISRILYFLSNKYYLSWGNVYNTKDYMIKIFSNMLNAKSYEAYYLDFSDYDISNLYNLM